MNPTLTSNLISVADGGSVIDEADIMSSVSFSSRPSAAATVPMPRGGANVAGYEEFDESLPASDQSFTSSASFLVRRPSFTPRASLNALTPGVAGEEGGEEGRGMAPHVGKKLHWWLRPKPRQVWLRGSGDGKYHSSLALTNEHRTATPADLILDLVVVVMLAKLGANFRETVMDSGWDALQVFLTFLALSSF